MNNYLLRTNRLGFRSLHQLDLDNLFEMFRNPMIMKHYPSIYTRDQTSRWLSREIERMQKNGYGMLATELVSTREFVGAIGLTPRVFHSKEYVEIAYMLKEEFWGRGLATEGAFCFRDFGFEKLQKNKLVSLIFEENISSISIAKKIGMRLEDEEKIQERKYLLYSMTKDFSV